MNAIAVVLLVLFVGLFLNGCQSSPSQNYGAYNNPQNPQQGQYVGGGCGVAANSDYADSSADILNSGNSVL